MINLVSIRQARHHLRVTFDETNTEQIYDLEQKIQQASAIIFDYLKIPIPEQTSPEEDSPTYDYWSSVPTAIPYDVKAATLLVVSELWENREATTHDCLSPAVKSLLHRHRDPALA